MALVALKSSYDQSNKCEIRKIWNQPQLKGELRATQRFINVVAECFWGITRISFQYCAKLLFGSFSYQYLSHVCGIYIK